MTNQRIKPFKLSVCLLVQVTLEWRKKSSWVCVLWKTQLNKENLFQSSKRIWAYIFGFFRGKMTRLSRRISPQFGKIHLPNSSESVTWSPGRIRKSWTHSQERRIYRNRIFVGFVNVFVFEATRTTSFFLILDLFEPQLMMWNQEKLANQRRHRNCI